MLSPPSKNYETFITIQKQGISLWKTFTKKLAPLDLGKPTKNKRMVTNTRHLYKIQTFTKKKIQTSKNICKGITDQLQMDLVDMGKYRWHNKGYYWILTAIEILSRYAFAISVHRKNTENMTKAVNELLVQFKARFGKHPNIAQFDEGKEFYNVGVKALLCNPKTFLIFQATD